MCSTHTINSIINNKYLKRIAHIRCYKLINFTGMNTEQKLLEIQRLLSEVVGEFEIRSSRFINIDNPFSRTLDYNARSIRELHRGLHTSGKLNTWITNLRRADKLTDKNEQ